jgi:hypothetical protein
MASYYITKGSDGYSRWCYTVRYLQLASFQNNSASLRRT